MHSTSQRIRNVTFFVLIVIFALLFALISPGGRLIRFPISVQVVLAIAFELLGLLVVVMTARLNESKSKKILFWVTGVSAAAMPICALMHNLVYALFIWWFGEGFWERHGADEPVFFILAIVVFPALFLIGSVGSIVFLVKDSQVRWLPKGGHKGELR
jgi:hypothetical protein